MFPTCLVSVSRREYFQKGSGRGKTWQRLSSLSCLCHWEGGYCDLHLILLRPCWLRAARGRESLGSWLRCPTGRLSEHWCTRQRCVLCNGLWGQPHPEQKTDPEALSSKVKLLSGIHSLTACSGSLAVIPFSVMNRVRKEKKSKFP